MAVIILEKGTHWKDALKRSKDRYERRGERFVPDSKYTSHNATHIDRGKPFPYDYVVIDFGTVPNTYSIHNNNWLGSRLDNVSEQEINAQIIKWGLSHNNWIAYGEFKPEQVSSWQEAIANHTSKERELYTFYEDVDSKEIHLRHITVSFKNGLYDILRNDWERVDDISDPDQVTAILREWGADPDNGWH